MGCNKNSECLRLANTVYPGFQSEINSASSAAIAKIQATISQLKSIPISSDYLGTRVEGMVNSICSNLQSDIGNIESSTSSINSFIGQKISEHQAHYNAWKLEQERIRKRAALKAKKLEESNLSNVLESE